MAIGSREYTLWGVGLFVIVAASIFPVLWILSLSLKDPATVADGSLIPKDWTFDNYTALFEGEERHIGESITVWTHGIQHDDGHIDDGTTEAPGISVDGVFWDTAISSDTARRLADLLVMAAEEIDGWA